MPCSAAGQSPSVCPFEHMATSAFSGGYSEMEGAEESHNVSFL